MSLNYRYVILFLSILKVKQIHNRLKLAYRTENKLVLIVSIFYTSCRWLSHLPLHFLENFFLHLHRMSFLHAINSSASIMQIGAIDPLLLSSYTHFFKMIGSDSLKVASHHVLRNSIKIKQ